MTGMSEFARMSDSDRIAKHFFFPKFTGTLLQYDYTRITTHANYYTCGQKIIGREKLTTEM
jgi:hypothetical protein